eukprot:TRINITY_DN17862_c0_g1_i2.p1 TRINITY_DN17862_c0_g1~~TRINITY_DN17862_c0_g1_i2.p1  ORF type:complete len:147 (+),score=26.87 TRINITY_DN17862_c0_g1_i2:71-511(+)
MSSKFFFFFFLMIRRPPRSTLSSSSAASDVYKRQVSTQSTGVHELIHDAVNAGGPTRASPDDQRLHASTTVRQPLAGSCVRGMEDKAIQPEQLQDHWAGTRRMGASYGGNARTAISPISERGSGSAVATGAEESRDCREECFGAQS